jgi:hypothetical protein
MHALALITGVVIMIVVLMDAFETVILPRRIKRTFRLTGLFFRYTWQSWLGLSEIFQSGSRREAFLSYFGPLSLIGLLLVWATGLIFAFALLHVGAGSHIELTRAQTSFGGLLYVSGATFFTLGASDALATSGAARALTILEGGMGFAFLAIVIGYLPTIYSAFSRREVEISLLDARAGSPPSASELLTRLGCCPDQVVLDGILRDWERWAGEILESHLSYPVLSYYRSQHGNQSWLAAMTTILDTSALLMVGVNTIRADQAKLTFAAARHAVVDLAQVLNAKYDPHAPDRLPPDGMDKLSRRLAEEGLRVKDGSDAEDQLTHLRALYEPYVWSLSQKLRLTLPQWLRSETHKDNWQGGPWDKIIQAKGLGEKAAHVSYDHF